jgi:CheY-like chemotaxis protein
MNPFLFSDELLKPNLSASSETSKDAGSHTSFPRILVVDDESLIADTIVQILNRNGFIAEAAYSGADAVEIAGRHCPDLLLSDVLMPNMDGVEVAIAVRALCADTRIVLFSGQAATVEILERAKKRGHTFELLPKPIHPTQLIKHLRD